MLSNELVVFVGAGVSIGSGFPSWDELLEEIQSRLGIKENLFNDNTIVPQLYYNARGKKDYNELIHDLLYKPNAKPNEIHKCLAKVNPRYIITTNYDNLLEQAFSDSGIFLDVIEKDSDLPYAHTDHMIIKMHGGFKHNNFVLKEDDYLNYTRNFTLIENYIKALFARYTVLFIGYSFNDPDTKQLLAWVRHILKEDQQRAYLVNVSDDFDSQSYEYYKNNGINIIYAKLILDNMDDLTKRTVAILEKIIVPKYNILAEINSIFKGYDVFNYISGDYIQSVFNKYFTCTLEDESLIFHCQTEKEYSDALLYFDKSDKDTNQKVQSEYPYIIKILRKSPIKKVVFIMVGVFINDHKREEYIISDHIEPDNILQFEEFDYVSIKNTAIQSFSDTEDNYLQNAYLYYFLRDYMSCYKLLGKAAKYYLSTNQLELYLITESNRIVVGKTLSNNPFAGVSQVQRVKVKKELNMIETYGLYANSYAKIKNNNAVSELIDFRYIYKNLYRIIEKGRKVDEEARTYYLLHTGKKAYEQIEHIVQDLYNYMQYNYLLLDIYSETKCIYTAFIEYIFLSLSTKEEITDDNFFESTYNIVLNELSRFDVLVILRFLTYKEIKNLTSKYNIDKIDLREDVFEYLLNVIKNINNAYQYRIISPSNVKIYGKLFHILKMVDLPQDMHASIFETLKVLLHNYNASLEYAEINSFIAQQYKDRKWTLNVDEVEDLIITICITCSHNNSANSDSHYIRILKNLAAIMHQISPDKKINTNDKNTSLFSISLTEDALISLYSVVDEGFQRHIQERIHESLTQATDVYTYYNALIHCVIQMEAQYEDKLYDFVKNSLENNNNETITYASDNYLIYCLNLLFEDKLINREKFIDLVKRDKSLFLLIDPDNFDYNQFEPPLLLSLTSKSLEILSNNKGASAYIHIALKKYLSENWDEKLAKIYINFFS